MVEAREAAWNRVNEQFGALADRVKQHYQTQDEAAPTATEASDSVRDALRTLGDAADRLASTVGDAVRDPDVKSNARLAANSLVDAIGLTLSQIGGDLRARTDRRPAADDAWDEPKVEVVDQTPDRPAPTDPQRPADPGPDTTL